MRNAMMSVALLASFAGLPLLAGCDKTTSHTKTETKNADGTGAKTESKTTVSPDGTKKTEETKEVKK